MRQPRPHAVERPSFACMGAVALAAYVTRRFEDERWQRLGCAQLTFANHLQHSADGLLRDVLALRIRGQAPPREQTNALPEPLDQRAFVENDGRFLDSRRGGAVYGQGASVQGMSRGGGTLPLVTPLGPPEQTDIVPAGLSRSTSRRRSPPV